MKTMTWYKTDILTRQDILNFIDHYKKTKPRITGFDTETDGLHIIKAKPFLIVIGYMDIENKKGYTYSFDFEQTPELTPTFMYAFIKLFNKSEKVVGHNTSFDLHMLHNIGYPNLFEHNITDNQIYIRLGHDALSKRHGGVPMKLKTYAKKYIDPRATEDEKKIKQEISRLTRERNQKLKTMLAGIPLPEKYKVTGRERGWTIGIINEILKDKLMEIDDLDEKVASVFKEWLRTTKRPTNYKNLNREKVRAYAHKDVIYTLEIYYSIHEVAYNRGQKEVIEREEQLIHPLYRMERVGFRFNREYTLKAKEKMKRYILRKRERMYQLARKRFDVGQHELIKRILRSRFDLNVPSTGEDVLKKMEVDDPEAQEFIDTLSELRTLEKWYSTYIIRWLKEEHEGRIYTTIHQSGAVSGRVSSDFQQFPKEGIKDENDELLFHPRRMIQVTGDGYDRILFIDYSQIELRIQAIYTLMVSDGDLNLCRAYMPFKCKTASGERFDPFNKNHINRWNSGEWYLEEDPEKKWQPLDVHTETTKNIFPGHEEGTKEFKKLRAIGKMTNFACNYGASAGALAAQLGNDRQLGEKAFKAYLKTFPKVRDYRNYIQRTMDRYGYVENLFGRRYYNTSAHNAQNYMIQGSGADFLKQKIIELDKFLRRNRHKTRMQMNIHDEISFELHNDDPDNLPDKLQHIMEQLAGTPVPIVADKEITDTTWDEKRDME